MKRTYPALAVALVLAFSAYAQVATEKKAPSLVLKDMNGKTVRLSDFKGKVVLLNFWATWCSPCAAEVPELVKWQSEYKDKLQILGVTYPPTHLPAVRTYVRKKKINYLILLGSVATKKLFEKSETLPVTVIVDKHGNIAVRIDGVIFPDEFESKIKPLLK